jgi:hypothetical protein
MDIISANQLKRRTPKKAVKPVHFKSLMERYPSDDDSKRLLTLASQYWDSASAFRLRRRRARMYYRGDQWGELIYNSITKTITTEAQYLRDQGRIPFKQNIIRTLVKNVVGQYRSNPSKSSVIARDRDDAMLSEMLTNGLQTVLDLNISKEIDARNLEEFAMSGAVASKTGFKYWEDYKRYDGFISNCNVARMFWNTDVTDIRGYDISFIGEIHDNSIDEIVTTFATNRQEIEWLKNIYTSAKDKNYVGYSRGHSSKTIDSLTFLIPDDTSTKCRVIEVWEKRTRLALEEHDLLTGTWFKTLRKPEEVDAINESRILQAIEAEKRAGRTAKIGADDVYLIEYEQSIDTYWEYKFITPYGHCLKQGESPFDHGSHPYSILLYPLIDGEIWGLVEDVIDQQRFINRIIGLLDAIIGSSAKGILLVPEDCIPDDMDIKDFATEWSKFNGVIKIKLKAGAELPHQVSANSSNIGLNELLQIQMQLIEQISGVHSAQQGKAPSSGTPSSLYHQQVIQAGLNNLDLFESYNSYVRQRDSKLLKVICQYYTEDRFVGSTGKSYSEDSKIWKPDLIKGVDTDVRVVSGMDTPAYRMMIDDILMQLFTAQAIDVKMYLENSSIPYADKILDSLNKREQEVANNPMGQTAMDGQQQAQANGNESPYPPEMQAQAAQADPRAMELVKQYAGMKN